MPTTLIRKQFLLTEDENKQIEAVAAKQGLSVSNLTRKLHGFEALGAGGNRAKSGRRSKHIDDEGSSSPSNVTSKNVK